MSTTSECSFTSKTARNAKIAMSCSAQCYLKNSAHIGAACGENPANGSFPVTTATAVISPSTRKPFGTQRHPNPNLARPPRHAIRHHSVQPHAHQCQRQRREKSD